MGRRRRESDHHSVGAVREPPTTRPVARHCDAGCNPPNGALADAHLGCPGRCTRFVARYRVMGRPRPLRWARIGRGRFTNRPYGWSSAGMFDGIVSRLFASGVPDPRADWFMRPTPLNDRYGFPRDTDHDFVGAVREPPTTRAVARHRGAMWHHPNNAHRNRRFACVVWIADSCPRPAAPVVLGSHWSWAVHEPPLRAWVAPVQRRTYWSA